MAIDIIKKEKVSLKSSLVTLLSHQGKLTKAAANSKNIYSWYSTITRGRVYHSIIAMFSKILQISHKYLINLLINILVFTSSVF